MVVAWGCFCVIGNLLLLVIEQGVSLHIIESMLLYLPPKSEYDLLRYLRLRMARYDFKLSRYGRASSLPSPVNRMMASFAADFRPGRDINLGVGYVNEQTIPYDLILESMRQVLADPGKYRVPFNYGGPEGSVNLINSIRRFYLQNSIGCLTREVLDQKRIIIGPSGATSLLEGIAHVLKPGIVITADPMYYIYCNYLERLGFQIVTVAEDQDGINIDLLHEKLDTLGSRKRDISFFYIVTVNNPTGTILSNKRRQALVEAASALSHEFKRTIPVICDKAYEDLVHDAAVEQPRSGLLFDSLGIVYEIGTLSKILSPAMRIGYMIGADGPFLRAMVQKTSDVGFSAPLISQETASYMLDHHVGMQIAKVQRGYREKAAAVRGWIDRELSKHLAGYSGGKAGFYFYLTFKEVLTTEESPFFRYCARATGNPEIDGPHGNKNPRVLYVPGEYCVHPRGDLVETGKRQLRLSYGFEELDNLQAAIGYMKEAAAFDLCE